MQKYEFVDERMYIVTASQWVAPPSLPSIKVPFDVTSAEGWMDVGSNNYTLGLCEGVVPVASSALRR